MSALKNDNRLGLEALSAVEIMTARKPEIWLKKKKSLLRVPSSAKTGTVDHGLCDN